MMQRKPANLACVIAAQVLALALWFSGTAAFPAMLREDPTLPPSFQALLTNAVQLGFVLGTLASATLALPDRLDPRRLFAAAATAGAAANAALLLLPPGHPATLALRLLTGAALAGVYPVGIKLAVAWAGPNDTGFVTALLVAGLTIGSASPHLALGLGGLAWRPTIAAASLSALAGAALALATRLGPRHAPAPPFRPTAALLLWRTRTTRLATIGYLGHQWELYAMWAWVGPYLAASIATWRATHPPLPPGLAPGTTPNPALATFAVIAIGSLGCLAAGRIADRIGKPRTARIAMVASATCCLLAGPAFGAHPALTTALCLVWGLTVVADSAQFSAIVAEAAPPGLAGTLLTTQICLGFALTLVTIQLMPPLVAHAGWGPAFATLAIGPALGALTMRRLDNRPRPGFNSPPGENA